MKGKQRLYGACVAKNIVLIRSVYYDGVYPDIVVSKFWFVRSFSSQHHSKFIANITSENVSQVRPEEYKMRSFTCKVDFNFLPSSRYFKLLAFAVVVSFLNESVHRFNNIRNGRVKTRFQIVKFWRIWKILRQKHEFPLGTILVHWWVG